MNSASKNVIIFKNIKFIRSTPKATLYLINGVEQWVPKSLMLSVNMSNISDTATIVVPKWFVDKNGLDGELLNDRN